MHHRTYTSTEAMTTAQVIVQVFYAIIICIFKLQATQISTVTSQSLQALLCNYIYKPVVFLCKGACPNYLWKNLRHCDIWGGGGG